MISPSYLLLNLFFFTSLQLLSFVNPGVAPIPIYFYGGAFLVSLIVRLIIKDISAWTTLTAGGLCYGVLIGFFNPEASFFVVLSYAVNAPLSMLISHFFADLIATRLPFGKHNWFVPFGWLGFQIFYTLTFWNYIASGSSADWLKVVLVFIPIVVGNGIFVVSRMIGSLLTLIYPGIKNIHYTKAQNLCAATICICANYALVSLTNPEISLLKIIGFASIVGIFTYVNLMIVSNLILHWRFPRS